VTAEDVAAQVRRFAERIPQGAVLVIPDRRLDTGRLVRLIDTARSAGAHRVTIATREPYNE
jgi:biopolymer transport protein ExbD